jgi:uncharacterized OsmC-like protein
MGEVGFDNARCVGKGTFWTSTTTVTMDFVATKSLPSTEKTAVQRSRKSSGVQPRHLVAAAVAAALAFTLAKLWYKRA